MPPSARDAQPDPALAAVLRRLRTARGWSQEALAREADLATGAVARIERAEANPTWTTVRRLATALGVGLEDLAAQVVASDRT
jgi:transcriptional regulator with XRE-family HTH domain